MNLKLPHFALKASLVAFCLSACAVPISLPAQAPQSASFIGTVLDTSGAPVEGANVTVTETETGAAASAVTDDQGRYYIQDIAMGTYDHEVEKPGFQRSVHAGIQVARPNQFVVDVILQPSTTQK